MGFWVKVSILVTAFCLGPGTDARAHKVYLFAWNDGGVVHTESYFPNKKKVIGGRIEVFDPSGNKLAEGETDERGVFTFDAPRKGDLRIVLNASTGHGAEFLLKADETGAAGHRGSAAREGGAGSRENPALMDSEELRRAVEQSLDDRLKPVMKALTELRKEREPGIREIAGGIGYLVGIMGVVLYVKSRRRKEC